MFLRYDFPKANVILRNSTIIYVCHMLHIIPRKTFLLLKKIFMVRNVTIYANEMENNCPFVTKSVPFLNQ